MRADFQGNCAEQEYAGLVTKIDQNLVRVTPTMSQQELTQAITEPAKQVGIDIDPKLVNRMIDDLKDAPGYLPLLQYALMELWQTRTKRWMSRDYDAIGGVKEVLQKRADEVYESLRPKDKNCAQLIFLKLTQVGDVANTRRRVRKQDLVNEQYSEAVVDRVIQKLADARLITTDKLTSHESELSEPGDVILDIAHEALIRHWKKLEDWVKDFRLAIQRERRIEDNANEWDSQGRPENFLLREGGLARAEDFKNQYLHLGFLNKTAREFIKESQNLRDRLRQEEEERRQREQKQAISALSQTSGSYLFLNKQIEALVAAMQAGKNLKDAHLESDTVLLQTVSLVLQQAVYGVKEHNRLIGHTNYINVVSFSPDGQMIASGSNDAIKLWSREGKLLKTLPKDACSISFSRDSKTIVSGNYRGTIQIWSQEGDLIREFPQEPANDDKTYSISLSPDGQMIASGDGETIKLWSRDGHLLNTLTGHDKFVKNVTFSPDGEMIASGSDDKTIKLWSREGKLLQTLLGHE
ncbi:hypothetical protein DP117_27825, partial [Brasilonema sp. UFV-L1]